MAAAHGNCVALQQGFFKREIWQAEEEEEEEGGSDVGSEGEGSEREGSEGGSDGGSDTADKDKVG